MITINKGGLRMNEEFEKFVKAFAEGKGITVEEALTHKQVQATKEYYEKKPKFEWQIQREHEERMKGIEHGN